MEMKKILSMAALAIMGAVMTGCSSEDNIDNPQQPENKSNVETLTTTVSLDANAGTRALDASGHKTFAVGDQIAVVYYNNTQQYVKAVSEALKSSDITDGGKTATFTVTVTNADKTKYVSYVYPASMAKDDDGQIDYAKLYNTQDGTLASLAANLDCSSGMGNWGTGGELPTLTLTNYFTILALTLKDNAATPNDITGSIRKLTVSDEYHTYTVIRTPAAGPIYVAVAFMDAAKSLTINATDGTNEYVKTTTSRSYAAGGFYNMPLRMTNVVAVDLGLSTGTKWANMNVGATSESDYGLFFAWGETTGYAGSHDFGWTNYKWSAGSKDGTQFSKYVLSSEPHYWGGEGSADNKTKLDLEDDAAHANWGGSWRMPTYAEVNELLATETDANYTWTWTSVGGHNGYRITNNSTSATIFLPAAGYWDGTSLTEQGNRGLYWTSSLFDSPRGLILYFSNMTTPGSDWHPRSYGFTVRPVK